MNIADCVTAAVAHLSAQPWVIEKQKPELRAVVSHWLQDQVTLPPHFSDEMRQCVLDLLLGAVKARRTRRASEHKEPYQACLPLDYSGVPYPPPTKHHFTFIDLFAGIGGFRLAFQRSGGKCVFSSEWDKYCKLTYEANFGECPYGDIRAIPKDTIPDHDVLCAGFPCQPFSIAGVSKKNSLGRKHGFEDETQGTLFFEIKETLRVKRPLAFMLENVKHLQAHDNGKTFEVICRSLSELGYVFNWAIVDGGKWVPQHRERIFIVGYDSERVNLKKSDILIPQKPGRGYRYPKLEKIIQKKVEDAYTLGPGTWDTLERHKAHHSQAGNGFGYGLLRLPITNGTVTRTISARYHKDGAEVLIEQPGKRPRRLIVQEAMQLQGYDPERFVFPVSNTQAYRQIGNSVVVPAVYETAQQIAKTLEKYLG